MNLKSKVAGMLFAVSTICTSVNAFVPGGGRALLTTGEHHEKITINAIIEIYTEYGYSNHKLFYSKNIRAAIESISKANSNVDYGSNKNRAIWHCDGEQLNECSNLVKEEIEKGVEEILSGNISGARDIIGAATHPLQDFYSHSNWVEMKGAVVNDEMGYGNISNVAGKEENTCEYGNIPPFYPPILACSLMSNNNIITTKLTSGYFEDTSIPPPGVKKCFHGGSFDGLGSDGINKDSSMCFLIAGISILGVVHPGVVISPHNDFHKPAADAAHAATVKYFRSIRETLKTKLGDAKGEAAFMQFLGIGTAIGFAIDTTTSMKEEINGVKNATVNIVKSRIGTNEEPSLYVLSIINDPVVPKPLVTTSSAIFLNTLSKLYPGYAGIGGTDCPELSGEGVYNAVLELPIGSSLYVFTDASAKDQDMVTKAEAEAVRKNIQVSTGLSGSCSPYDPLYFKMADRTGGQVFIIKKDEAGKIAELSDVATSSYYTEIAKINDEITLENATKSYDFKVDSKTDKLSISISVTNGSINASLVRPDDSIAEANESDIVRTVLSSAIFYNVKNPNNGTWRIDVGGKGEFTIKTAGTSPLSFDSFKFVQYGGRAGHQGFFAMDGIPIAGTNSSVEASLSGVVSDVRFELRSKSGEFLDNLTLDAVDEYEGFKTVFLKEGFIVPDKDFIIYAFGKDENGVEFQRVFPQKITSKTVNITAPSAKNLPLDTNTIYTFRVTNYGESKVFSFKAVNNKGYAAKVEPVNASIEKDGFVDVSVIVNPGNKESSVGEKSVLTFSVYSEDGKKSEDYTAVESVVIKSSNRLPQSSLAGTGATIDENGDVYIWGFRALAQQGNEKIMVLSGSPAAKVESLSKVTQLTGGAYHLIALDANGDVWGWGESLYGESGCERTSLLFVGTPCKVIGNVKQVAAGKYFSMALDNRGDVYTWGHNLYGQLGSGGIISSQTPILVNLKGEKVRLIGAAYRGAFAVTESGHVYSWGYNSASGLGFKGSIIDTIRTPEHVTSLDKYTNDIVYIGGGKGFGEALLNNGTVIGWGLETALGQGTTDTSANSPEPVVVLHNVKQLFARHTGSVALSDEGVIYTWGYTNKDALRHIYGEFASPHDVGEKVIEIGGGREHIFYQTGDESLYGVGRNSLHKLDLDKFGGSVDWPGVKIEYK
jgi:alpha-tubulin suppressor-like RCC1 family protein